MTTISKKALQLIITEELAKVKKQVIAEGVDHEAVRTVVNAASKLLKSVDAFKKDAAGVKPLEDAVIPHLDALVKTLENMVSNPASYVVKPTPVQKVVKLRPQKEG